VLQGSVKNAEAVVRSAISVSLLPHPQAGPVTPRTLV